MRMTPEAKLLPHPWCRNTACPVAFMAYDLPERIRDFFALPPPRLPGSACSTCPPRRSSVRSVHHGGERGQRLLITRFNPPARTLAWPHGRVSSLHHAPSGSILSASLCLVLHAQQFDLRSEGDARTVLLCEGTRTRRPCSHASKPRGGSPITHRAPSPISAFLRRVGNGLALRQLLLAGIGQYLDQRIHFGHTGVRSDVSDERIMADLNDMARAIAAQFNASEGFGGFTDPPWNSWNVTHIDWSKATFGIDAGNDQDKYLAIYYYVRSQRQELERQLCADLLPLAGVELSDDRSGCGDLGLFLFKRPRSAPPSTMMGISLVP